MEIKSENILLSELGDLENVFIKKVLFEKYDPLLNTFLLTDFKTWQYPIPDMDSLNLALENLKHKIEQNTLFGEIKTENEVLDVNVSLANISHLISEVFLVENKIFGNIKCLNTPSGELLKEFIKNKFEIKFHIRATGSVGINSTELADIITWDIEI